jgi:hypothetical protein
LGGLGLGRGDGRSIPLSRLSALPRDLGHLGHLVGDLLIPRFITRPTTYRGLGLQLTFLAYLRKVLGKTPVSLKLGLVEGVASHTSHCPLAKNNIGTGQGTSNTCTAALTNLNHGAVGANFYSITKG